MGPRCVLGAALHESRRALDRLAQQVPARERDTSPVCGVWTTKDVLGHVADWEACLAAGVAQARERGDLAVISPRGIDAWNVERAARRREGPWDAVWAAYDAATPATGAALAGLDEAGPARVYPQREPATPTRCWRCCRGTAWSMPGRSSSGYPQPRPGSGPC